MKLTDLFDSGNVCIDFPVCGKNDLLRKMVADLNSRGHIGDIDRATTDVIEREAVMSTGIGSGVAIPHAYTDGVEHLVAGFYRTAEAMDFESLDGKPVDLFFIILGPKESRRDHIKFLAKVSRLLNHSDFRAGLRDAADAEGVMSVLRRFGDR